MIVNYYAAVIVLPKISSYQNSLVTNHDSKVLIKLATDFN